MDDTDFDAIVENIQRVALETTGNNIISTELTYHQALNIYVRSVQLEKESNSYLASNARKKQREIDICWNKKKEGKA